MHPVPRGPRRSQGRREEWSRGAGGRAGEGSAPNGQSFPLGEMKKFWRRTW